MWCQAVMGPVGQGSSKFSYLAKLGGEGSFLEMLTKERLFRKVCRFSEEFLILAIVE